MSPNGTECLQFSLANCINRIWRDYDFIYFYQSSKSKLNNDYLFNSDLWCEGFMRAVWKRAVEEMLKMYKKFEEKWTFQKFSNFFFFYFIFMEKLKLLWFKNGYFLFWAKYIRCQNFKLYLTSLYSKFSIFTQNFQFVPKIFNFQPKFSFFIQNFHF